MRYFFLAAVLFTACTTSLTDLPDFDETAWQNDPNGCKGVRSEMQGTLEKIKDQLKGLDQDQLITLLGKPDRNELYKRNQKFFFYLITPGADCKSSHESDRDESTLLSIRFNATGLAKEVMIVSDRRE